MNTETKLAKKRGPKPSGIEKVVYYRRVVPAMVDRLDAVLMPPDDGSMLVKDRVEAVSYAGKAIKEDDKEFNEIKKQLEAMTASYLGEVEKVAAIQGRLDLAGQEMDQIVNWTEDEKTKYWRNKCFMLEAAIKAKSNEFNQE